LVFDLIGAWMHLCNIVCGIEGQTAPPRTEVEYMKPKKPASFPSSSRKADKGVSAPTDADAAKDHNPGSGIPDDSMKVTTRVAAKIVGRAPSTLKRWRYEGIGPEYTSIRNRVRYDVGVLVKFNEDNTHMPSVRAAMEADREDF
jgi:hypothetical protein